ncbi:broad-complex core protein isoforms 1/2/3/4/5-like [Schistocerca nitens]|uniref:broad-complex core protein isoforms 1/2/3/4/5-like n=1 Tax=Schistocerca nitens TaxID=7011 RepID=UPI0021177B3F|nr:broad-complex core protein isoforms 1/2/3/4/5-like [Schistocerca nitens]XP_049800744.1 broad-complex core protein isoforms 1/2/3/4/5-like [Schistocerca nitens]
MGSSQQYSLRWNNYPTHVTGGFSTLRNDEELVDVTLSCEGKRIRAHKMLLSVCSTYFRELFKENPCQHPVIIFRNVKFEDLVALLDFIYLGEVNVMQEQLTSFLTTAELLAVQGLSDDTVKDKSAAMADSLLPEREQIDLTDSPPPVHKTVALKNSGCSGLSHNRREISSPRRHSPIPGYCATTSVTECHQEALPNKRRRRSSPPKLAAIFGLSGKSGENRRECPIVPTVARISAKAPAREPVETAPSIPEPHVKMEDPDYIDDSRTSANRGQLSGGAVLESDTCSNLEQFVVAKTEGDSSLAVNVDPPDALDVYGSSSQDVDATSDSLPTGELPHILVKAGPSEEKQNEDMRRRQTLWTGSLWQSLGCGSEQSVVHHLTRSSIHGKICLQCKLKQRTTARGSFKQTRFLCAECNVRLCREPCFDEYHIEAGIPTAPYSRNYS